jgi:hypothetical protein
VYWSGASNTISTARRTPMQKPEVLAISIFKAC